MIHTVIQREGADFTLIRVWRLIPTRTEFFRNRSRARDCLHRITKDCAELVYVRADAVRLRQVFANLLDNALKFTPPGGSVVIAARREPEGVVVRFRDSGIGIDGAELPRIWDRLYRVEKSRGHEGLGLGLSLVKAIVQAHGGSVEASSEPGQGAEFRVILLPG
jgi:signal transduction histidine kinase